MTTETTTEELQKTACERLAKAAIEIANAGLALSKAHEDVLIGLNCAVEELSKVAEALHAKQTEPTC